MKTILTTRVHGGWEYEFAKIGYPILRVVQEEKDTEWRYLNNMRPAPPNVTCILAEDIDKYRDEIGCAVINDRSKLRKYRKLNVPKFFVPHTIENAQAYHEFKDDYHVVNTLKYTEELCGVKGSLIYSSVSLGNYEGYDLRKSEKVIVSNCANVLDRPSFAGLELWRTVTKGLEAVYLGWGNDVFVPNRFSAALPLYEYVEQMKQFRIFFNPTQESIMPMVVYDAMALGMPIVTAATCGCPEVIQNGYNGYISNDPAELRKIIELLLEDDEECLRIGRNAQESARKFFNADRMAAEWRALLKPYIEV